jgi:hypothetical protein
MLNFSPVGSLLKQADNLIKILTIVCWFFPTAFTDLRQHMKKTTQYTTMKKARIKEKKHNQSTSKWTSTLVAHPDAAKVSTNCAPFVYVLQPGSKSNHKI